MTSALVVNTLVLIAAIIFWVKVKDDNELKRYHFDPYLLVLGTIGSIIHTVSITLCFKAFTTGPLGPVASLVGMLLLLGLGIYVKVQSQSSSGEQPFRLSDNDTSGNVTARDIEEYAQRELFAADWTVLLLNRLGPLSLTA